jgi:hypothetical protein
MKLVFIRTDADEWMSVTPRGDYTIIYDDTDETFTLFFLPVTAGSLAKEIATTFDKGSCEIVATKHYNLTIDLSK